MPTEVVPAGDPGEWNDFVRNCPSACVYHDLRWKAVFERTFGHTCHYLVARAESRVTGVLPLVEMRSRLFGRFLVSLPFVTYGGLLCANTDAAIALARAAVRIAEGVGASRIELRQRTPSGLCWTARQHKAAMVLPLPETADTLWNRLSSRLRGKVRKATRSGARLEMPGAEGLDPFYRVFARNMRDLGTPVYPFSFFRHIVEAFPDDSRFFVVTLGGRPVAASLGLRDRTTLQLPWICSDYSASAQYVNEFLYWSMIEWSHRAGYRCIDFGRSGIGTGNYRFKSQWGLEATPLCWYSWTADGRPAAELNPQNPRYALAIRIWKMLPLAIANSLGPRIVRGLP